MSFLRFSPTEYQALCQLNAVLKFDRKPLPALQKLLVRALAETLPDLSRRLAGLGREELQIVQEHFQQERKPPAGHGLTEDEVGLVVEVSGPFPFHGRFVAPLQRGLVRFFRGLDFRLSAKLEGLSPTQFELLCAEVRERTRKGA